MEAALQAGSAMAPAPLADDGAAVDEQLDTSEDRMLLAGGFAALDDRERRVLHLRFYAGLSQTEIAAQVGLSQAHVSRIIRDALAKLRDELGEPPGPERRAGAYHRTDAAISPPQPVRVSPSLASPPPAPTIAAMTTRPARSLDEYLDLPYHLAIARDDEASGAEAWVARVEELDGCVARGATPQEAVANVRAALEAWIAPALARGQAVPVPRAPAKHSGRLLLRMEPSLHAELARAAEREEVSLNQFVSNALAGAVGWRGGAGWCPDGPPAVSRADRAWTPGSRRERRRRRDRGDHRDRAARDRAAELSSPAQKE